MAAGFQIHVAVNAGDHQIQFRQRVPFDIHRAVFQNVALEPGEDADSQFAALVDASAPCCANSTTRFSSRPKFIDSALEWSVIAMYW